jgi:glucose/arabinose dehydrogenase
MGGPVYRHREGYGADALPRYYDGKVFIMERQQNWIKYVTLDEAGEPVEVDPFLPGTTFRRPMDMTVGPDGALYVAEWGSGWDAPNEDSGIYRIARPE